MSMVILFPITYPFLCSLRSPRPNDFVIEKGKEHSGSRVGVIRCVDSRQRMCTVEWLSFTCKKNQLATPTTSVAAATAATSSGSQTPNAPFPPLLSSAESALTASSVLSMIKAVTVNMITTFMVGLCLDC